jgi:exonuclease III
MTHYLQIALWNANGLSRHRHEVQMFLFSHNIDVLLISETHCTTKNYFRLPHYTTYHTNHPSGYARGGSAIIIKNSIKHNLLNPYNQEYLRATSIALEGPSGHITISAVYLPPKHAITHEHLSTFFSSLGHRFLAGGDYNVKYTIWGSGLNTPRGRTIQETIELLNYRLW